MLISFSFSNWMSFKNTTQFSMVAEKERQHGERVPKLGKYKIRALPIAAIYGGNASGKTNFFKALSFAKKLVVHGTQPDMLIPMDTFKLDPGCIDAPSTFAFQLLLDETIFEFSFTATRKKILEEKLVKITSTSEKVLYARINGKITLSKKDNFLKYASQGTRDNQLFLTNAVSQKVEAFKPIYDWFREKLILIAPDSRFEEFEQFIDENKPQYKNINKMLQQLGTGIARLGSENILFENLPLHENLKTAIIENVNEGKTVRIRSEQTKECFIITREKETFIAKKLVTYHTNSDGQEVKFDLKQESDGTQRLIDLTPAFLDISLPACDKVFVIDEIDRCLHTLLTRQLLENYLSSCSTDSRTQLLFTTHDVLSMDQDLLRRDEIWVSERDAHGASTLVSFSEYKDVRYDKDIRKSYLQGRMGGIPQILLHRNS